MKTKFNWKSYVLTTIFLAVLIAPLVLFNLQFNDLQITYLFGDIEPYIYKFAYIFAGIGLFLKWFYETRKGVKYNEQTPEKFNSDFWIKDNFYSKTLSLLFTYFALFIMLRFSNDIFSFELTMFFALLIGLLFEEAIDKIFSLTLPKK